MARNMALGARGEDVAVEFLIDAGLEIVERNWRCRYGELDVVATSGDRIVFVEVKTRSGVGCRVRESGGVGDVREAASDSGPVDRSNLRTCCGG